MAKTTLPDDAGRERAEKTLEEIQKLVGTAVMVWADLDNRLIALLSKLAECPPYTAGVIYYSQSSLKGQLNTLRQLAKHNVKDSSLAETVIHWLSRIEKLAKVRNTYVHSVYTLTYNPSVKYPEWNVMIHTFKPAGDAFVVTDRAHLSAMSDHIKSVSLVGISLDHLLQDFRVINTHR